MTVDRFHRFVPTSANNAQTAELEKLRRASLTALREKYREAFQQETRSRHREQLFRRLAWRLQALAEGDLSERARQRAKQIARDAGLRKLAPPDFLTVGGERIQTARESAAGRQPSTVAGDSAQPQVERTNPAGGSIERRLPL